VASASDKPNGDADLAAAGSAGADGHRHFVTDDWTLLCGVRDGSLAVFFEEEVTCPDCKEALAP
jgi:hypothetical protein